MEQQYFTPPNHVGFLAKQILGEAQVKDVSIAHIQPNGGGPTEPHTHAHDHLFIVTQGEAKILLEDQTVIVRQNEEFLVSGNIPHSVWNNSNGVTTMIGINIHT